MWVAYNILKRNKPSQHVCNNSSVTSQFNSIKDYISNTKKSIINNNE